MTGLVDLRLRTALSRLDAAGRLLKIESSVDPILEAAGIIAKTGGGPAVFMDHVAGYDMPIFANALASAENVLAVFGQDQAGVRHTMTRGLTSSMQPVLVDSGPCQQVVVDAGIDVLGFMPVLQYAAGDGGRYLSSGVVMARDPETGIRNCSFHRFQIIGGNQALVQLDMGRHLRAIWQKARQRGLPSLPIAICLGSDLSVHYAAGAMGAEVPLGRDELEIAGGFRGEPLPVVKCKTIDMEVPAEAEIILEGQISTTEEIDEGPFVEFVGYYSQVDPAPIVTFQCLTHRRDPIYYPIIANETIMLRKFMMEAALLRAMKAASPMVLDCELTRGGLYRFQLVLQVRKQQAYEEGMQRNVALAAITVLKDLDCIVVVDEDIDIHDPNDVQYAISTRLDPSRGLIVLPGFRGHEYVPASDHGLRSKLIVDATRPFREGGYERRVEFMQVDLAGYQATLEPRGAALLRQHALTAR